MNEEIDLEELAPWLVIVITLAGGFLRGLLLADKGMWLDETFSVWLANQSVPELLHWLVKIDQHPPLYYLLLHYWLALTGDTPYYARLLSVLFGLGTIPLIYLIGRRLAGDLVGLAAAVILALSPFHIYFAQETRMYTLLAFNAAAALYALVRLLTDARSREPIGRRFWDFLRAGRMPGPSEPAAQAERTLGALAQAPGGPQAGGLRRRGLFIAAIETDLAWIAFGVFSAATMLSHNTAIFFPLAANVFVLGLMLYQKLVPSAAQPAFHAPSFGNWAKVQIGIAVLWSPWAGAFVQQARAVSQRFWIPQPDWDGVLQVLRSFLNASAPLPAGLALAIWLLYGLVLCLGLAYFRKRAAAVLLLAALFATPFLGELLVSVYRPVFLGRTLIWATLPLFLLLAAGVAQFKFRYLIIVVLGTLSALNLFAVSDYYRFFQKEDWSTAAGFVALFAEKDDLVLFNSNFAEIPFDYYFETYETHYDIQVVKQGVPLDLFASGVPEPPMTPGDVPGLVALLTGHKRVWLVYSHASYTDPLGLIPQVLAAHKTLMRTRDFYGGQVQLYGTP